MVRLSRDELLTEIRKRFPKFHYHPLAEQTVLTAPEWEAKSAGLLEQAQHGHQEHQVESKRHNLQNMQNLQMAFRSGAFINLEKHALDPELELYQKLFQMPLEIQKFQVKGIRIEKADLPAAAVSLVRDFPTLAGTWSQSPEVWPEEPAMFWNRVVKNESGGSSFYVTSDSLLYALFAPVHHSVAQWLISMCAQDVLERLFAKPLVEDEWTIFRIDTTHSSYFNNDFWEFLWVVFHRDGKNFVLIYGTDTD